MLARRHLATVLFTGLSCVTIGCQADDSPGQAPGVFTVRDSAGIEIVENVTPAWDGDGWRVSAEPSVTIGRLSGDERYFFGEVAGALVLRDGRIAVLDGQTALIRVYSPQGVHITDRGGWGEGPGESSGSPRNIFPYRGDSILVEQFAYHGFNIFDDQVRFGRVVASEMWLLFHSDRASLFDPSLAPVKTCCTLWGPLPNGAFLGSYSEMLPYSGSGTVRASVMAAVTPGSGGTPEAVGIFNGGLYNLLPQGGRPQRAPAANHQARP